MSSTSTTQRNARAAGAAHTAGSRHGLARGCCRLACGMCTAAVPLPSCRLSGLVAGFTLLKLVHAYRWHSQVAC